MKASSVRGVSRRRANRKSKNGKKDSIMKNAVCPAWADRAHSFTCCPIFSIVFMAGRERNFSILFFMGNLFLLFYCYYSQPFILSCDSPAGYLHRLLLSQFWLLRSVSVRAEQASTGCLAPNDGDGNILFVKL